MAKKTAVSGEEQFESFYLKQFGDRWGALKEALLRPERQILRKNRFVSEVKERDGLPLADHGWWQNTENPGHPERTADGLLDVYIMDPASLSPALALEVQQGDRVLDLCAAPGGKSLILAEALWAGEATDGELLCNDLSPDRRERLIKVLQQYLPRNLREGRVFVKGQDGVQFGLREPESFQRILLDAPCSGERHLLENPAELKQWSPRRSEGLAARQYSLLSAAWLAISPGGRIVYSTCALSELEDDGVLRKFFKKKKEAKQPELDLEKIFPGELAQAFEKTEFGYQFLPDRSGIGPIYFAVIEKGD